MDQRHANPPPGPVAEDSAAEEYQRELDNAGNQVELEAAIFRFLKRFHLDLFSYAALEDPLTEKDSKKFAFLNNYPDGWDRYDDLKSLVLDPVLDHVRSGRPPISWSTKGEVLGIRTPVPPVALRILAEAGEHGFRAGITAPIATSPKTLCFMTFGSESSDDARDLFGLIPHSFTFASLVHQAWMRIHGHLLDLPSLTPRERECLRLYSMGLTAADIAQRLHVSERTVRYHLDNVRLRLNAGNLAAATREAVLLGLI